METTAKLIALNHPERNEWSDVDSFMRDSFAGERKIKEGGERHIIIPPAMNGYKGEKTPHWHYIAGNQEANDYIRRAHYPDVCSDALDQAVGRSWSRDPEMQGEKVIPVLDTMASNGADFQTFVLDTLEDYLKVRCGGLFVNLNEDGDAVVSYFPAEAIKNWSNSGYRLKFVVLETAAKRSSPFEHNADVDRLVLGIDDDTGHYFIERWEFQRTYDERGRQNGETWALDEDGRVFPTFHRAAMTKIPFFSIGGWTRKSPTWEALANTARRYYQRSAEYNHLMWWTATPQPFIDFGEKGNFYGLNDQGPSGQNDDQDQAPNIEIRWGANSPILLQGGDIKFAAAPSGALTAHLQHLEKLTREMGSLGNRSFSNQSSANVTAETERLQQNSEGSAIHAAYREVAKAITLAIRFAADWRRIKDADMFEFKFNQSINFNGFDFNDLPSFVALHQERYFGVKRVWDIMRKIGAIPASVTDEQLRAEIAEEFGAGDFGTDLSGDQLALDEIPPDDFDADEIDDDDLDEAA